MWCEFRAPWLLVTISFAACYRLWSRVQGVHMVAFDMMVRSRTPRPPELEGQPFEWNEKPMEVRARGCWSRCWKGGRRTVRLGHTL